MSDAHDPHQVTTPTLSARRGLGEHEAGPTEYPCVLCGQPIQVVPGADDPEGLCYKCYNKFRRSR